MCREESDVVLRIGYILLAEEYKRYYKRTLLKRAFYILLERRFFADPDLDQGFAEVHSMLVIIS